MARITADDPEEGEKFAYRGTAENQPLSYDPIYNFYVMGDMILTAYCIPEDKDVEEQVMILCTPMYNASTRKLTFTAKRSLPEGCKVISHGVVIIDSQGWDSYYANNVDGLHIQMRAEQDTLYKVL